MFKKLDEVKVLRDPIHDYIHIEYKIIWDCVNSREFQRLRRIKQQGSSFVTYHTAEHTRFGHSLGVYEIVRRMCEEVKGIRNSLTLEDKIVVMLAGLLHDIGHGPFSHTFEAISDIKHEIYSCRILEEDTEIHEILENAKRGLSSSVACVINHTHPNPLLSQMINAQLDADRMDYLLRDAYFTGTTYGEFDLERILRTLRVKDNTIMVKESGIHSIEDYIMARYHMYWQVYYHPVARSFESVLSALFERMRDLLAVNPNALNGLHVFDGFINVDKPTLEDHFLLDENVCFYGFQQLMFHDDKILSDLARRLVNRDLFQYKDIDDSKLIEQITKRATRAGYHPKYYIRMDRVRQRPYQPVGDDKSIWILMDNGEVKEISESSTIVSSLIKGRNRHDNKLFFPKGI
ncbi:MAG: HD domain-containing protein [Erysipelotrichaceae bacterium]|jgi:HD superfamily phosphohydrolase|nr:HD domain-containing protein [Erysipelotrichaceae bacterium]HCW03564.1 phosphohydrolase [Clostridium sp.]